MKKNTILSSITALTLIVPALADPVTPNIAVGTNPADCTEPVLGTTSGTSNLQANWNANTLNLQWTAPDADNWSAQNNTCTYDSGITVPQTNPSRTGYTFAGWHVKTASNSGGQSGGNNQTTFDLSTWNYGTVPSLNGDYIAWTPLNGSNGLTVAQALQFKVLEGGRDHSAGLNNGEWTLTFGNGTVKGIATCSNISGNNHDYQWGGNSADWSLAGNALQGGQYNDTDAKYCWCKATGVNTGSGYQSVAASSWVFDDAYRDAGNCAYYCANGCATYVQGLDVFRAAVFGVTQ